MTKMKKIKANGLLVIVLLFAVNTQVSANTSTSVAVPRIVNGNAVSSVGYKNLSFMAQLYYDEFYSCTASFISQRFVLTAAHCVTDGGIFLDVNKMEVLQGVKEGGYATVVDAANYHAVKAVYLHPLFSLSSRPRPDEPAETYEDLSHDIALIELQQPVEGVQPIELVSQNKIPTVTRQQTLLISGWGDTNPALEATQLPEVLRYATAHLLDNRDCNYYGFNPYTDLCAGNTGVNAADICSGDSGGPLFLRNDNADVNEPQFYQIGVVSAGNEVCATEGFGSIFTSTCVYTDFIRETVCANDPAGCEQLNLSEADDCPRYTPAQSKSTLDKEPVDVVVVQKNKKSAGVFSFWLIGNIFVFMLLMRLPFLRRVVVKTSVFAQCH